MVKASPGRFGAVNRYLHYLEITKMKNVQKIINLFGGDKFTHVRIFDA